MTRKNWKRMQPTSLRQALEFDKERARDVLNLSMEGIAAEMGLADHWNLYKWIQTGRMPIVLLPLYERVCGSNFALRWLAATNGKLLIDMPKGRSASAEDMQALQELLNTATGGLLAFYGGKQDAQETLSTIQQAMEGLAWHHGNVRKHAQPELDLGEQS